MIHPSYVELMKVVNNDVEIGDEPEQIPDVKLSPERFNTQNLQ